MRKYKDLTGQTFGYLKVDSKAESHIYPGGKPEICWNCTCLLCGNKCVVKGKSLKQHHTRSCGCLHKPPTPPLTHGMSDTRLYNVWRSMKQRCYDKNCKAYKDYGARGIVVCDEWLHDFKAFYDWSIENGYDETADRKECTLDRENVNGNYEPDNCRWVSMAIQCNNKTDNHILEYEGVSYTLSEAEKEFGIPQSTIRKRLKIGWSIRKTLETPLKRS